MRSRGRKKTEDAVPPEASAPRAVAGSADVQAAPGEDLRPPARTTSRRRVRARESDREAVLAANAMFYRAFEVRDLDLMGQLWANQPYVRCIHPGWEPLFGWEEVMGSWDQIFRGLETLQFRLADVSVRVGGDLAWVELSEMLEAVHEGKPARTQVLATNLYERGADGRWRLIHHHASPVMVRHGAPRRGGASIH